MSSSIELIWLAWQDLSVVMMANSSHRIWRATYGVLYTTGAVSKAAAVYIVHPREARYNEYNIQNLAGLFTHSLAELLERCDWSERTSCTCSNRR